MVSIGSLVAELRLQSAQFIEGMKKAADATAKATGKMAADIGALEASIGAFGKMAARGFAIGAALYALERLNKTLRRNSEAFRELENNMIDAFASGFSKTFTGGINATTTSTKNFAQTMQDLSYWTGKAAGAFTNAFFAKIRAFANLAIEANDALRKLVDTPGQIPALPSWDEFQQQMADINDITPEAAAKLDALAKSAKAAEDAAKALAKAEKDALEEESAWAATVTEAKNAMGMTATQMEAMQKSITEYTDTIAEGIADAVVEAKSFEEALKDISKQVAKMALTSALKSIFAVGSDAAFGTSTATAAPLLHSGGTVGLTGARRSVPSAAFVGAPRFHKGFFPGEIPAILQRGESVLTRGQMRSLRGGGVSAPVSISIDARGADAGGLARVQAQLREMQRDLPTRIIKTVREARSRRVPL